MGVVAPSMQIVDRGKSTGVNAGRPVMTKRGMALRIYALPFLVAKRFMGAPLLWSLTPVIERLSLKS